MFKDGVNNGQWTQSDLVSSLKEEYPGRDAMFFISSDTEEVLLSALRTYFQETKLNQLIEDICEDYANKKRIVFAFRYVLEQLKICVRITRRRWSYQVTTSFEHPKQFTELYLPTVTMIPNKQYLETMVKKDSSVLMEELAERIYHSDEHAQHVQRILNEEGVVCIVYLDGTVHDIC